MTFKRGEEHHSVKLTAEKVQLVRRLVLMGGATDRRAAGAGVHEGTVGNITRGGGGRPLAPPEDLLGVPPPPAARLGERQSRSKLTEAKVREAFRLRREGWTHKRIAA